MHVLADVGAQSAARNSERFHALDMLTTRADVRIAIGLIRTEPNTDVIYADLIVSNGRSAAEIQIALHRKALARVVIIHTQGGATRPGHLPDFARGLPKAPPPKRQ